MNKRNEGEILFAEGKIEEAVKFFCLKQRMDLTEKKPITILV